MAGLSSALSLAAAAGAFQLGVTFPLKSTFGMPPNDSPPVVFTTFGALGGERTAAAAAAAAAGVTPTAAGIVLSDSFDPDVSCDARRNPDGVSCDERRTADGSIDMLEEALLDARTPTGGDDFADASVALADVCT